MENNSNSNDSLFAKPDTPFSFNESPAISEVTEQPATPEPTFAPAVNQLIESIQETTADTESVIQSAEVVHHPEVEAAPVLNPGEPAAIPVAPENADKEPSEEPIISADQVTGNIVSVETQEPVVDMASILPPVEDALEPSVISAARTPSTERVVANNISSPSDIVDLVNRDVYINGTRVCHPYNDVLRQFLISHVFGTHPLPNNLVFDGAAIAGGKSVGIWEEGGRHPDYGSVLLVTDQFGAPMPPIAVFYNEYTCGRHALVAAVPNCYLVVGGCYEERNVIAIYRVTNIHYDPNKFMLPGVDIKSTRGYIEGCYSTELVAYRIDNVWTHSTSYDSLGLNWERSKAVINAELRMNELYAASPCYVNKYRPNRMRAGDDISNDLNACLRDTEFMQQVIPYTSLADAYAAADAVAGDVLTNVIDTGSHPKTFPLLTVYLYMAPGTDNIGVHLFVTAYNSDTKTSDGNRLWYGQVSLPPGSSFWYPDQSPEQAIAYSSFVRSLIYRYGGKSIFILRRMTIK